MVTAYPYLIGSALFLALAVCALLVRPDQRRPMLLSGVLSAKWASAALVFVPHYWDPPRILGFRIGVEDVLYSFAAGVIVWFLAASAGPHRLVLHFHPRPLLVRYLTCVSLGSAAFWALWAGGVGVMGSALTAVVVVGGVVAWIRAPLRRVALAGAIGYTVLYTVLLGTAFALWPHLLQSWNIANLWGIYLFNIPLEEMAWAAGFGAVWPLLIAYGLDARVIDGRPSGRRRPPLPRRSRLRHPSS